MSSSRDWPELASDKERLVAVSVSGLADARTVTPGWAELASRNERLVGPGDPLLRLACSEQLPAVSGLAAS
jgi:hypothetical protein